VHISLRYRRRRFHSSAYAVYDFCHTTEQDRDEGGNCAENKGRCRRLRHHLRELSSIRDKVHASARLGSGD
jgi:hypothetical protein